MNFLHSHFLLGLLGLLPLLGLYIYAQHRKRQLLAEFTQDKLWGKLVAPQSVLNERVKLLLTMTGISLVILALAQPRWGFQWQEVPRKGVDIVIALDVSRSMLAQDVPPDRLTRAKRKILDLLKIIEGDRVGLVAFAGTSFLQSPLTLDYSAIEIFLEALDTELIPVPGTAIAHAIRTSVEAFSKTQPEARAILLITDGEDQSGDLSAAAKLAQKEGVRLFILGVGKPEGAPIPAQQGGFQKNRQGELVLSKLNESALAHLAESTGGSYIQSVTGDIDLEKIYRQDLKGNTESQELTAKRRQLWTERFQWFILGAIFCWMLEGMLASRSSRNRWEST